jgi:hypothetical protein
VLRTYKVVIDEVTVGDIRRCETNRAPDDDEMQAAWEAWSQPPNRATELRGALQMAIQAGNGADVDRLRAEVRAVLEDHRALTEGYKRLKAQRPDWQAPRRTA